MNNLTRIRLLILGKKDVFVTLLLENIIDFFSNFLHHKYTKNKLISLSLYKQWTGSSETKF